MSINFIQKQALFPQKHFKQKEIIPVINDLKR